MKLLDQINVGGNSNNYDAIGHNINSFWVLDGASAPLKSALNYDINQWLVSEFSSALKANSNAMILQKLTSSFESFKSNNPIKVKEVTQLNLNQQPSFAMALLTCLDDSIECGVIADCSIVIQKFDQEFEICTDKRVNQFSNLTKNAKTPESKLKQIIANREFLNKPKGYWVGSSENNWFNEVQRHQFNRNDICRVLLCSDGFSRAVEFKLFTWQQILNQQFSFEHIVNTLRDFERTQRSSDYKRHDDASAYLISIA